MRPRAPQRPWYFDYNRYVLYGNTQHQPVTEASDLRHRPDPTPLALFQRELADLLRQAFEAGQPAERHTVLTSIRGLQPHATVAKQSHAERFLDCNMSHSR